MRIRPTSAPKIAGLLKAAAVAAALACATPAMAAAAAPAPAPAFDALVDDAKTAMMVDPAKAHQRSTSALKAAEEGPADADRPIRIATAQWLQGEALLRMNRLKEAVAPLDQALAAVSRLQPNTNLHGRVTMARADVLGMSGDVQGALSALQTAYKIFEVAKEPRGQAMALQNIGSIYLDAGDFPKVQHYYAQSAEVYKADPALLVSAYNNVGKAREAQGEFSKAAAEYARALAVAREMHSPLLEARILTNMAGAEASAGRLSAADAHVKNGLRIAEADPAAHEWRNFLWGVAAKIELQRGDADGARVLLERTFQGIDLDKSDPVFRDFHEIAYKAYSRLGDDRLALRHLLAFKRLDDQAKALAVSTNAALMSAQFDFANQETKIAQLKAGQLERDVKLARSRNTISLILLIGSGFLLLLLAFGINNMRISRNQLRKAYERLSDANVALEKALQARTEFLATTSHEIRTPLNGILGMTQVILADTTLSEGLRDKVGLVHTSGETMLALVDDILDVAKIETGHLVISPVEMDLHQLLNETSRLWADKASSKGLRLAVDISAAPVSIVEDVTRLRQIVFNLMSNAIKFTEAGEVALLAAVEGAGTDLTLRLDISDSGIGIPADKLDEIFESFRQVDGGVTRKYGGTGLGLAICKSLVTAMGGTLTVDSRIGEGSTFSVRLPLTLGQQLSNAPVTEEAGVARSLAAACVLVIEANPLAQSLLRAGLAPEARAVEVVASAAEALELLHHRNFDLIVAEGGALAAGDQARLDVLRAMRAASGATRLSVMWGGPADQAEQFLANGADHVVRKPIGMAQLIAELSALSSAAHPHAHDPQQLKVRNAVS